MPIYYVSRKVRDGDAHEVHTSTCSHTPLPENAMFLGQFPSCLGAVAEARKFYDKVEGCCYCCEACHAK